MGDWFQTLVVMDTTLEESELIADRILSWLIERKVVQSVPQSCVLGGNRIGYPPLDYEQVIDELPSTYDVSELLTNGLQVDIGKRVYDSGQSDITITCPKCNAICKGNWSEAISDWYENERAGLLDCFQCGIRESVTNWNFSPVWGFGNLGFTFWNWPLLKQSFIDEMKRRIAHRTVFVTGKL